jgi:NADPH-dependent 2,4-dienoyl-CoA reductase/sulfur reductase-like enzyme
MAADAQIEIDFEGDRVVCAPGVSLAAALASAGEYGLRAVNDEERRGVFCGIGVCQECVVDVEGLGRVRSCMTKAEPGMRVTRAVRHARPGEGAAGGTGSEPEEAAPDVLVIGGGAAGLTAAATLAEQGVDVVLLDERSRPGGQYYKQPFIDGGIHESLADDPQILEGADLVGRARASGAKIVEGAEIWGAFVPGEFIALANGRSTTYRPKHTIVATGACERGLPLPGWTLPGVMTAGAAQTMLKSYGEIPGKRVLVAGNGPLNLQIAEELHRAGAEVVAVTELAPSFLRRPGAAISMMLSDAALSIRGIRTLAKLKSAGIPVLFGHGLARVEERDGGLHAEIGPFDGKRVAEGRGFDVDVVCTGFGFLPNNEILRALGCEHRFDEARGQMTVVRTDSCETSIPGIFAIGDCCGLGGAPAACEEGVIAAAAIAESLTGEMPAALVAVAKAARRRLQSHRSFQAALWEMFKAPRLQSELADDETVVCRCESVRLGQIKDAMSAGDLSMGAVKRRTRLGMGACQARYCAPVAASLLSQASGEPLGEFSYFAPRVPIKPIRIADIAGACPNSDEPIEMAALGKPRSEDR